MIVRLSLLFLICPFLSLAQVSYSLGSEAGYIKKLEQKISEEKNDSVKANSLLRLALLHRRINNQEKSKANLDQAIALCNKYPFLIAASSYYSAMVNYIPGQLESLERELLRSDSLLLRFEQKESFKLRAIIWNNYATFQQIKGDEKGALAAFTDKAAELAKQSSDKMVLGKTYKGISIVMMNANQRAKAADYLNLSISNISQSDIEHPVNLVELIEACIIAGENYVYLEMYDSANEVLGKAKKFLSPYPSSNLYLLYHYSEGVYRDKTNQYDKAIKSFDAGIELATRLNSPLSLNRLKYAKFKTLYNQKKYQQAADLLEDLIKSQFVFTNDKKLYYQELYSVYSKLGDTKKAFERAQRYIALSDSLYEQKFQKDIIELENKYKHNESKEKIASLQMEQDKVEMISRNNRLLNWLLGTVSVSLLITVVFIILLYRQNAARHLQQLKEVEQNQQIEVTKALMQGEEKERKRLAIDLHDGLGGQLAGIKINLSRLASASNQSGFDLQKVIDQLDSSSNELRRIARNMMPETLLLLGLETALKDLCESMTSDSTQIIFQPFDIDARLDSEMQMNIYRIVQELLTNATRHANASEILVQCSQNSDRFFITIEDNGKGFKTSATDLKKGLGLSNIQSRVKYLKGKIDISSELNEGTTINIEFDVVNR